MVSYTADALIIIDTVVIVVITINYDAMDKEVAAPSYIKEAAVEEADKEMAVIAHIEASPTNAVTLAEKRLLRKIDFRVLPMPILLVGLSSIDRVNISSARVAGMAEDLDLGGNRYNVVVLGRLLFFPFLSLYSAKEFSEGR